MMATVRQAAAPPPKRATRPTVMVWISMLVPKANMKRIDPIWTRSWLFLVTRAVRAE